MLILCLLALACVANSHIDNTSKLGISSPLAGRADRDPADFGWIKRWAAIGDSYTAGIGSGEFYLTLYGLFNDWECSRYDLSYPVILDRRFGPSVEDFQFVACSGDRTMHIYEQAQNLDGDLDLVIMTAGGNDLCLAGIIKACVFLPFQSEQACQDILDKAQSNIDAILKPNIKQILVALNGKVKDGGYVVYNKYAQFFNTDSDDCETKQDWSFPNLELVEGLPLTAERRKKFNQLVLNINEAIQETVDEVSDDPDINYKIRTANWDIWPRDGVKGQFCEPGSTGEYPDPKQPDLHFFKPDTSEETDPARKLRRAISPEDGANLRELRKRWTDTSNTVLEKSPNPQAEVLHKLDPRAPEPPDCPGDDSFDWTFGLGLPDRWGKFFHPNEQGHRTIAAFAMEALIDLRAEYLDVTNPLCEKVDDFKCWQKEGRKAYADADQLDEKYREYCDEISTPAGESKWRDERRFLEDTPDEHTFSVKLSAKEPTSFSRDKCKESFRRIIHGCDGNDDDNPMNWKFGGRWVRDVYTYEVNIERDNRPWPPIKEPYGSCEGWYKVLWSEYEIHGAGWSTWDFGQETIVPSIKGCLGLGLSGWDFEYFDKPDDDGMEWRVTFDTPIWVRARCFENNKVAFNSGGFTDGCSGND